MVIYQDGLLNNWNILIVFFKPHHLLVYGDDLKFVRSYIHVIYKYHPFAYKIIELLSKILVTKKIF